MSYGKDRPNRSGGRDMQAEEPVAPIAIHFLTGPLAGQAFPINQPVVTIGRDLANDVPVKTDLQVSRQHARLHWSGAEWRIANVSRGNLLRVNDVAAEEAPLPLGAVVQLGDASSFTLRAAEGAASDAPQATLATPATTTSGATATEDEQASQVTAPPSQSAPATAASERAAVAEATQIATADEIGMPTLEVSSNTSAAKTTYPLAGATISIGRDAANDIAIRDRIVSGQHLQIVREGETFVLVHPHPGRPRTLNGLLFQGRKIRGDEHFTKTLVAGDIFRIGDENGTLVTLTYRDGSDTSQVPRPTIAPIHLSAAELTIGRQPDNTIVLAHPQVSGHHAWLTREGATYRIADLNSTNHVYVNGEIIAGHTLRTGDEIRIGPYRLVYEGNQLRQFDESSFIRIDALGLKKLGTNNVTLLDDISLSIPPRSFVALVGGSGAGKSTLMDALNGLRPAHAGRVLYNGHDYYQHIASYSAQIGYVPQEDIVHRDLTVERALYYAAKIRLPSDFSDEQIEQRIREVLDEVELTHRRTLMIRNLSGGQRKRVSIALELLANPGIFFLDEPTSGLDPGLDRKMMFLLRRLADRGHTIVLVTHATNNINSCDYVCFLSAGGRLAYFGPPEHAKGYFGKSDFAEIYTSLEPTDEAPEAPEEAQSRFRASTEYARYVATPLHATHSAPASASASVSAAEPPAQRRTAGGLGHGFSQFLLLALRYLELLKNDPVNLALLLLQAPIIALLLVLMLRFEVGEGIFNAGALTQCHTQIVTASGPLALPQAQHALLTGCQNALDFLRGAPAGQAYAQAHGGALRALQDFMIPGPGSDAQKALFIMAFATILFGCINGAREFVKEAAIYRRERTVNLGILPYMFSKIVVLGLLCLLQSAIVVLFVQVGEPLRQGLLLSPFLEVYITLVLTALAGLMFGLTISVIAPNADRAISFVPLVLLPQVLFSGAIIALKDWPSQLLAALFPSRWAMAALGSSVGLHADSVGGDRLFGSDDTYHGTLFSLYTRTDAVHRLLLGWGALAAITVILVVVIGVCLKRKDRQA
ncbi:MAG TPA: FHA domain-containing protein [Ktedonobacterales bacterium]|nr:FHA domain-containing protein [Ktedonobacterales bacterium]